VTYPCQRWIEWSTGSELSPSERKRTNITARSEPAEGAELSGNYGIRKYRGNRHGGEAQRKEEAITVSTILK
jgi:hypothetical protein